jgi:hypothetical protein
MINSGYIKVKTNISEGEQEGSFANGSLHSGPEKLAITIDTFAKFPSSVKTQDDAKAYLENALSHLASQGWEFNIAIGLDNDNDKKD